MKPNSPFVNTFSSIVLSLARVKREHALPSMAEVRALDDIVSADDYRAAIEYLYAFMLAHTNTDNADAVTVIWDFVEMACLRNPGSLTPVRIVDALAKLVTISPLPSQSAPCGDPECTACEPSKPSDPGDRN